MTINVEIANSAKLIAEAAVLSLNEQLISIEYIDGGSTSKVFRVNSIESEYVLKIAKPSSGKTASYLSDYAIRKALSESGLPVAKPVFTDHLLSTGINGKWALDRYCLGSHPERGSIPSTISKQLGELLSALHRLSADGFGSLENTDLYFQGECDTPIEGLLSRFESPWPFSEKPLNCHPSVCADPALLERLSSIKEKLKCFPCGGARVIVHTDLHEAQILVSGDKLVALLDFNEAMIGRPEWDLGSYYYFHGRSCLADLLEGYTKDSSERSRLASEALIGATLIALHHGNRGEMLEKPHRIAASVRFLAKNLQDIQ